MDSYRIVPAEQAHVAPFMKHMRPDDYIELSRAERFPVAETISHAITDSTLARTLLIDGEPAAIWGFVRWGIMTGSGSPWLVTGRQLEKRRRLLLIGGRIFLDEIKQHCPHLVVMVDREHHRALRWLKWLGFELQGPFPHGPYGKKFVRAEMRPKEV